MKKILFFAGISIVTVLVSVWIIFLSTMLIPARVAVTKGVISAKEYYAVMDTHFSTNRQSIEIGGMIFCLGMLLVITSFLLPKTKRAKIVL